MFWIIAIVVICSIVASVFDSVFNSAFGRFVIGASVVAIGLLLLKWITGIGFFVTLAKACAAVIVVAVIGVILLAIIGKEQK